ncbi:hypothetical protein NMY22_g3728 [Coprinellus aureogranulatus]|nr:hypothetical protein NMY22_g3728 [Coprinellus aureogranulatus]
MPDPRLGRRTEDQTLDSFDWLVMRFTIISSTIAVALCLLSTGVSASSPEGGVDIRDAFPIYFDALDARTIIEDLDLEERDLALDDLIESREFIEALVDFRDFNDFIDSLDARDFDFEAEIPLEARAPRRGGGGGGRRGGQGQGQGGRRGGQPQGGARLASSGWSTFGSALKAGAQMWAEHRASQGRPSKVGTALQFAQAFNQARKGRN